MKRPGGWRPSGSLAVSMWLVGQLSLSAQEPLPADYYNQVDPSGPTSLRRTIHETIDGHLKILYTANAVDTWDVLERADEDPLDTDSVLDVYRNASYPKAGGGNNSYNREHSWPKSYGFPKDGQNNYPYTDLHHLFVADSRYNSSRSNKPYGSCSPECTERETDANGGVGGGDGTYPGDSNWTTTGVWETWTGRRGDVARALFYLDVRYEGGLHSVTNVPEPDLILTDDLSLVEADGHNQSTAYMGRLSALLEWHHEDPVDDREQRRNDVVFEAQGNRNPFIDHPEWVACLFEGICESQDDDVDAEEIRRHIDELEQQLEVLRALLATLEEETP